MTENGPAARRPLPRNKLVVLGLAFLLFGLPLSLAVTVAVFQARFARLPYAEQPGGTIEGRVLDAEGRPLADVHVEVRAVRRGELAGGAGRDADATGRTDAGGRYAIEVPAVDGYYALRAGGDGWQYGELGVSLEIGADGWDVTLRPGGGVRAEFLDRGERRGKGAYTLTHRPSGTFSFLAPPDEVRGEISSGWLERDGLAPGSWTLGAYLDGGLVYTMVVEVEAGQPGAILQFER